MFRTFLGLALAGSLVAMTGCAMCASPFDDTYPAYGGRCADGGCGTRAGSVFAAPGAVLMSEAEMTVAPSPVEVPEPEATETDPNAAAPSLAPR